jgi:hypothetical protein
VASFLAYRRWGGVDGLVADALDRSAEAAWPIPDTGTLADDRAGVSDIANDGHC